MTENINSCLSFKFIDENRCEVTDQASDGIGTVKKYIVPSKEVFDGIVKFSIENKKIDPISLPYLNYFPSVANPALISYDYFPHNQAILAAVYVPAYDSTYKFESRKACLYPGAKISEADKIACADSTSTLFKALASEGLIRCHTSYEDIDGRKFPVISIPWRQPPQLFIFLYSINMATAKPFETSQYISHLCWYVDGELTNGYSNADLYSAFLPNHYNHILRGTNIKANSMCFGSGEISPDIRDLYKVISRTPYTINNKDLCSDDTALKLLIWCSRDSVFRQELLKYTLANTADKDIKASVFKLLATGNAFNKGYIKLLETIKDIKIEMLGENIVQGLKNIDERLQVAVTKNKGSKDFSAYTAFVNNLLAEMVKDVPFSGIGAILPSRGDQVNKMDEVLSTIKDIVARAKNISEFNFH